MYRKGRWAYSPNSKRGLSQYTVGGRQTRKKLGGGGGQLSNAAIGKNLLFDGPTPPPMFMLNRNYILVLTTKIH